MKDCIGCIHMLLKDGTVYECTIDIYDRHLLIHLAECSATPEVERHYKVVLLTH